MRAYRNIASGAASGMSAAGAQYTGSDASPLRSGADHGRVLIKNVLRHTDRYASLKPYYLKLQVVGRDTPGIVEGAVPCFCAT